MNKHKIQSTLIITLLKTLYASTIIVIKLENVNFEILNWTYPKKTLVIKNLQANLQTSTMADIINFAWCITHSDLPIVWVRGSSHKISPLLLFELTTMCTCVVSTLSIIFTSYKDCICSNCQMLEWAWV